MSGHSWSVKTLHARAPGAGCQPVPVCSLQELGDAEADKQGELKSQAADDPRRIS